MTHRKNTNLTEKYGIQDVASAAVLDTRASADKFADIGFEVIEALPDVRNPMDLMKIQDRAGQRMMTEAVHTTRTLIGHQMQFAAAASALMGLPTVRG